MKDKRQRLSLAWPVADPMFAAYLLQAAGYPYPLPLAPSMPCYNPTSPLGVNRYSPYGSLPIRPHPASFMHQQRSNQETAAAIAASSASLAGMSSLGHGNFSSPLCVNASRLAYNGNMAHPLSPPSLPLSLKLPPTPPTASPPLSTANSSASPLHNGTTSPATSSSPQQQLSPSADRNMANHLYSASFAAALESPPPPASSASSHRSSHSQPRLFQPYKLDLPAEKA